MQAANEGEHGLPTAAAASTAGNTTVAPQLAGLDAAFASLPTAGAVPVWDAGCSAQLPAPSAASL